MLSNKFASGDDRLLIFEMARRYRVQQEGSDSGASPRLILLVCYLLISDVGADHLLVPPDGASSVVFSALSYGGPGSEQG
jgi:hypothetical protein